MANNGNFDFPSNNNIVEDKPANMVWIQWFQRVQSLLRGQTWKNVAASRTVGTPYTNGTGKPITVSLRLVSTIANDSAQLVLAVSGVTLSGATCATMGSGCYITAIIPNGETYTAKLAGGVATINTWHELR